MNFVNTYHFLLIVKKEADMVDQGCLCKAFINIWPQLQFERETFYLKNAERGILNKKKIDLLKEITFFCIHIILVNSGLFKSPNGLLSGSINTLNRALLHQGRDKEHIPGRQQGGAIDLLRGLQEVGVTWLFCPIHWAFQEQLWGVTFPKVLKVLLFPSDDCQQGWFVAVKLRVQGEPEERMSEYICYCVLTKLSKLTMMTQVLSKSN